MRTEIVETILKSLKYSRLKIQDFDYSYGHYDPKFADQNKALKAEELKKIDEAIKEIKKIGGIK